MTAAGPTPAIFDQDGFSLRFDWGMEGLVALAPGSDAIVIVDVLRFTTCVDVAVARGAVVLPYPWAQRDAAAFAARAGAVLAGRRDDPTTPWSLSPTDLAAIPPGTRLVLPSPNGSSLAFAAAGLAPGASVFAACLRNASSVAAAVARGGVVSVIAAGERWRPDAVLRPALEDLLGAGAVIVAAARALGGGAASPEARAAAAAFTDASSDLPARLAGCASGRELSARGWSDDIEVAAACDVSDRAPRLAGDAFVGG